MEKSEIKKILNKPYDRDNWKDLSKVIFNGVDFFKEPLKIKN